MIDNRPTQMSLAFSATNNLCGAFNCVTGSDSSSKTADREEIPKRSRRHLRLLKPHTPTRNSGASMRLTGGKDNRNSGYRLVWERNYQTVKPIWFWQDIHIDPAGNFFFQFGHMCITIINKFVWMIFLPRFFWYSKKKKFFSKLRIWNILFFHL